MSAPASRLSRPEIASTRDESIALLAPALGEATATEIVTAAAEALGLAGAEWTSAQQRALFDHVASQPGLVGITARVVTRRLRLAAPADAHEPRGATHGAPAGAHHDAAQVRGAAKPWEAVSDLLVPALGQEGAMAAVEAAVLALGLGRTLTSDDALRVLEHVAREPGVVGIAARFAKTRLHLLSW